MYEVKERLTDELLSMVLLGPDVSAIMQKKKARKKLRIMDGILIRLTLETNAKIKIFLEYPNP